MKGKTKMIGDILLSFFLVMPAVVAVTKSREMTQPVAGALLFWGGIAATGFALMIAVPMVACDGHLQSAYSNCIGAGLFTKAQPLIIFGAKLYVLVCIPLGVFAFLLETWRKRA
jgi:hypothetical protein